MEPGSEFYGSSKPPQDRNGNTLVITDIPPNYLSLPAIREYFAQFGEVTNVAVEAKSKRALVSFTSNFEAYQAWKSDEAIFGSRHVKVLWHKPRPGHGDAGKDALEKSANLIANMKAIEAGGSNPQGDTKATLFGPEQRLAATLKDLEAKEGRQKRETLMAEQKVLLKRAMEGTKEEKMTILRRLKDITKEVEELDKPKPKTEDVDMGDKEKLDALLEKHGMETQGAADQDELMKLSAQLSALRDKVSQNLTLADHQLTTRRAHLVFQRQQLPGTPHTALHADEVEAVAVAAALALFADPCVWITARKQFLLPVRRCKTPNRETP